MIVRVLVYSFEAFLFGLLATELERTDSAPGEATKGYGLTEAAGAVQSITKKNLELFPIGRCGCRVEADALFDFLEAFVGRVEALSQRSV